MSAPVLTADRFPLLVNHAATYQVQVASGGNPTSWTCANGVPGLSFGATTGRFQGSPTTQGTYHCVVTATNADGQGQADIEVVVNLGQPIVENHTYTVSVGEHAALIPGLRYSNRSDNTSFTLTFSAQGLPPGLQMPGAGIPGAPSTISGTPTTPGVYEATVLVFDGHASGSGMLTFQVTGEPSTGVQLFDAVANATVGVPFEFQVSSVGTAVLWYVDEAPIGLQISNTGLLSGTVAQAGTYLVAVRAHANSPSPDVPEGLCTITLIVSAAPPPPVVVPESNLILEVDLSTGGLSVVNGLPFAYFGDQKIIKVRFTPPENAGNVSGVTFTLKEKSEALQYQALLGAAGTSTDGTAFAFPVVTFGGHLLRDSLLLYDDVEPSLRVTYSLEVFFAWAGRTRKSSILDFTVLRPQDMDFAQVGVVVPVTPTNPGVENSYERFDPALRRARGGTPDALDAVDVSLLPAGFIVRYVEDNQMATYQFRLYAVDPSYPEDDFRFPPVVVPDAMQDSFPQWRRVQ